MRCLLQADVTANDDEDQALLKRFQIFGPPTIAFFSADGVERKDFRLVGFAPADRFRDHVRAAFASESRALRSRECAAAIALRGLK